VFDDGAAVMLKRLSNVAKAIGGWLKKDMDILAEKVAFFCCCTGDPDIGLIFHRSKSTWRFYGKSLKIIRTNAGHAKILWIRYLISIIKLNSGMWEHS
jgi:hypothetical protein